MIKRAVYFEGIWLHCLLFCLCFGMGASFSVGSKSGSKGDVKLLAAAVEQVKGVNDMPMIKIQHSSGSSAEVYLHGATVTSYKTSSGRELIYLSEDAIFNGKKAIRGGIPLIFPQFGQPDPSIASHGFVRTATWELCGGGEQSAAVAAQCPEVLQGQDPIQASLTLRPNDNILAMWPHQFSLTYRVWVGASGFATDLIIDNVDEKPFNFQALLHTYYKVDAIENVLVKGLKGLTYIDKLKNMETLPETRDEISIASNIDSIYLSAEGQESTDMVTAKIDADGTAISMYRDARIFPSNTAPDQMLSNSWKVPCDCVFWNPWEEKAKAFPDMPDLGYQKMVCLEPGLVATNDHVLENGKTCRLRQITITS